MFLGVSEERVLDGTPKDLEPFLDSYKLKQKSRDEEMWRMNQYTMLAVSVAVSRNLYGKKSKAKYLDKPILQIEEEKKKEETKVLTESEKKQQREMILMRLQLMKINFENNKKNEDKNKGE